MTPDSTVPARDDGERVRFITYRDHRILLLDFSHCTPQEVSEIADRVPAMVTQEPSGSVCVVADFTGAEFNRQAIEHIKIATAIDKPHIKRTAWVLDHNMPKALYDSVRTFSTREFPIFATRDEALEYLLS